MNNIAQQLITGLPEDKTKHPWEVSKWAKLLDLGNTERGNFGEDWVKKYLEQEGYKVEKADGTKHHSKKENKSCDLCVNDDIRVEVKLGFAMLHKAHSVGKTGLRKLVLDGSAWFHLIEGTADVYAFIAINPEAGTDYHVRQGWRTEHEDSFIFFVPAQTLSEWIEKNYFTLKYEQWSTGNSILKKINYGLDFREFPY